MSEHPPTGPASRAKREPSRATPDQADGSAPGRRRRLVFVLALVLVNLLVLEGLGYAVSRLLPQLISDPEDHLDDIADFDVYADFVEAVHDPVTGWENLRSRTVRQPNCLGETFTQHTDANGARRTPVAGDVRVLFVGDSFTFGHGVDDFEAYSAQVARQLDVPVANYGVPGFDPLQATLLLREKAPLHPRAEAAVLGIMYENIRRLRTGFRYTMHVSPHSAFQYKPWLDVVDGEVRMFPSRDRTPATSPEELAARATDAMRSDYYAPDAGAPPYLVRLLHNLGRDSTLLRIREAWDPMYSQYYEDDDYRAIMLYAVRLFLDTAHELRLRPLVFFLPSNSHDTTSPEAIVETINAEYGATYVYDAGDMKIDWDRYSLRPGDCHPSEYGHAAIAGFVAPKVRRVIERAGG
ncbi:MAG TPA: hypothetical protein ENO23_01150, partial [Alphaproteobacteria bacterium]|nr:hypothetical protein [Alphaproteobacteria bacterium]